jgi:hypothetical protein
MKKVLKIMMLLLMALMLLACNKYVSGSLYHKKYAATQTEQAYADVYSKLKYYKVDSIPIDKWILNNVVTDTIHLEQHVIKKTMDPKSVYIFVLTKYTYPSQSYYQFIIRYSGNKKYLIK